ncbi:MAG: acyl carrier protein [Pseudomonadota bacterium]
MTREDIFNGIKDCLVEVVDINRADIHETSKLIDDLGADSLDLLDLIFQLEQRFKIKLSARKFEKQIQKELGDIPLEVEGVYTKEAMTLIRKHMTEIPEKELCDGLTIQEFPKRFRVSTMINLVESTLENKNE